MSGTIYTPQEISKGSAHVTSKLNKKFDRTDFMIKNMKYNSAYKNHLLQNKLEDGDFLILKDFKERYSEYRKKWKSQPVEAFKNLGKNITEKSFFETVKPLCIDIETAAICDLACPHCYREYLITPDKIMNEKLFKKIIDEISAIKIPSIKLNWRGEPLLNPKIYDFISYSKKMGILEVSINTNATQLNLSNSSKLLDSGIDLVIFSFDGGTNSTYEKMRPGRFKKNTFENVYQNIKKFCELKKKRKQIFPITKIQMVLTENSRDEVDEFYELFGGLINDITVTQYQERGGKIDDLKKNQKDRLNKYIYKNNLDQNVPYMVSPDDKIFVSTSRIPCEQLFQRLMITYSGKVGMCCHDWGAKHTVGYIDEKGFDEIEDIKKVKKNIVNKNKGFTLLKDAKLPEELNKPEKKVQNIIDIWKNEELKKVRQIHKEKKVSQLKVCENCTFKETYNWKSID